MVDNAPTGPSAAELTTFGIKCPRCGQHTQKMVAWLATQRELPCSTVDCGYLIDLKTPERRALIEKLTHQALENNALVVEPKKIS